MKKTFRILLPLILLASLLAGCGSNEESSIDKAVLDTMVALNVQASQTAVALNAIQQATGTSAAAATYTPTATVYVTPTLEEVWLTVNENTNCRIGASSNYDYVATLMKGQKVRTTARNYDGNYYYVTVPEANNVSCWVWDKYLSIEGNPTPLPIYTQLPTNTPSPTPTPVPSFSVFYMGMTSCSGKYGPLLKIENLGQVPWESVQVSLFDSSTKKTVSFSSNNFETYSGCSSSSTQLDLQPNEEGYASSSSGFAYDPAGHKITATVTLFSKDNFTGSSYTQKIGFTP